MKLLKKLNTVLIAISLLSVIALFFTGCNNNSITTDDKNVTKIEIVEETLPELIKFDKFDQAGIKLKITYSDGSSEEKPVTKSMIPQDQQTLLETAGSYAVDIFYRKQHTTFIVNIDCYHVSFMAYVNSTTLVEVARNDNVYKLSDVVYPTDINQSVTVGSKVYAFDKWNPESYTVLEDKTIKATYVNTTPQYTVKFYNANEQVISTQTILEGEDAVVPTEQQIAMNGWSFCCWDRAFTNIQHNTDVYGVYYKVTEREMDSVELKNAKYSSKYNIEHYAENETDRYSLNAEARKELANVVKEEQHKVDMANSVEELVDLEALAKNRIDETVYLLKNKYSN